MAWTQGTAVNRSVFGDKRATYGTYVQENTDTGGAIVTGLSHVDYFACTWGKSYSVSGGTVTVTTADPGGTVACYWMAIGYRYNHSGLKIGDEF